MWGKVFTPGFIALPAGRMGEERQRRQHSAHQWASRVAEWLVDDQGRPRPWRQRARSRNVQAADSVSTLPGSLLRGILTSDSYEPHLILRRDQPGFSDRSDGFFTRRPVAPDGFLDESLLDGRES